MKRWYDLINAGDIDGFGELLAEDFVEHDEMPGLEPSKDGVKRLFHMYRAAFPDLRMEPQDVLVSGDKAVARVLATGTHQGEFLGMPATGESVDVQFDRHDPVWRRRPCPRTLGRLRRTGADATAGRHPADSPRIDQSASPPVAEAATCSNLERHCRTLGQGTHHSLHCCLSLDGCRYAHVAGHTFTPRARLVTCGTKERRRK